MIEMFRLADGKIVERWTEFDMMNLGQRPCKPDFETKIAAFTEPVKAASRRIMSHHL
jgi:hypothetical protein